MAKEGYHKTKSGKMAKKGLYYYINKKKKEGTSKPKSKSTISDEAYANMKAGFPKKKKRIITIGVVLSIQKGK